jgi:DedD protein
MRGLDHRPGQREIWITQGHLWALALVMFFIGVLSFFVGLLYGRSQVQPPEGQASAEALVPAEVEGDALDELLARLESLEVDDPQDGALSFPGTLPEGEAFPLPEEQVEAPPAAAVVMPSRVAPEPPEGDAEAGAVPSGGWAVQLASYATVEEADDHLDRLVEQGIDGYRQAAVVRGETRHRVRVGGYRSREAAERGREDLVGKLGVADAIVVQAP